MVTLEEYKEVVSARRRRECYAGVAQLVTLLVGIYAVPFGLVFLLLRPYGDAWTEACARWVVEHGVGPRLTSLIGLLICLSVGLLLALPVLGVWRLIERVKGRDPRLFCPGCGAPLGNLAVVTGNCQRCGERALELPEGGMAVSGAIEGPGRRLLSVEEFNGAVRDRFQWGYPKHRDPRLGCPVCEADLVGRRWQVVAARECPGCEAPVLEDPETPAPAEGPHPGPPRVGLAGFRAGSESYRLWCLFGGISLTCLAFAPMFLVVASWEALRRAVGETGGRVLAFAALLLGVCLGVRVCWLAEPRIRWKLGLDCPHCGGSLYHASGVVLATRRCYRCGRRALAEEGERVTA